MFYEIQTGHSRGVLLKFRLSDTIDGYGISIVFQPTNSPPIHLMPNLFTGGPPCGGSVASPQDTKIDLMKSLKICRFQAVGLDYSIL
jgi:hypothetical protein